VAFSTTETSRGGSCDITPGGFSDSSRRPPLSPAGRCGFTWNKLAASHGCVNLATRLEVCSLLRRVPSV
jgi:hypothetical protein